MDERATRLRRSATWLAGALLGAAAFLLLVRHAYGPVVPLPAAVVAVVGALLCGDVAEQVRHAWTRRDRVEAARG